MTQPARTRLEHGASAARPRGEALPAPCFNQKVVSATKAYLVGESDELDRLGDSRIVVIRGRPACRRPNLGSRSHRSREPVIARGKMTA